MFETNISNAQDCVSDGSANALGANLLITNTTAAVTNTISSSEKYARLHHRSLTVGIIKSLNSTASSFSSNRRCWGRSASDGIFASLRKIYEADSNTNNVYLVPASGFSGSFASKPCKTFSRKSFKNVQDTTSSSLYVPVPTSPAAGQQPGGNLSTRSQHVIDIPSDDEVVRIVEEKDLKALKELGGVKEVAFIFGSHLDNGIEAVQHQELWNTNNTSHTKGFFYFLCKYSIHFTNFLLLVSAGLSFTTEIKEQGAKYGWHDGVAILAAVSILVTFPSVANFYRSRKQEKKLWKERNKLEVEVVRSGERQFIAVSNLVAGDIVHLKKGHLVPADGLVVKSDELVVDDVLNPKINGDRNLFLFYGSSVKEGYGTMLVTSVGDKRVLDKLLRLVVKENNEKPLVEVQIDKSNSFIENLCLIVSVLIALVAFIRLFCKKHDKHDDAVVPRLKGDVSVRMLMTIFERIFLAPQGKISILASALTVAVIAIQHGMPSVITTSLSLWNEKVERNQAKPQNLLACATMGIVTVMCIDATGGLVCNNMEVDKFWTGEKDVNNDVNSSEIDQAVIESLKRGIAASVLVPEISVCPTDDLFVSWAKSRWNFDMEFLDRNLSPLQYRNLSSSKKCCGILLKNNGDEEKRLHMYWSGAASAILDMCSHYYDSKGNSHTIFNDERSKFLEVIKDMEDSGLRSIAFACMQTEVEEIKDDGLHLLALAGLKYPCPAENKSAVKAFQNAGVEIKLISEDELSVVRAIGYELGIIGPEANYVALEGEQIRDLMPIEKMEKLDQMTIMGSCVAEYKLLLVQSAQQNGHVVAFFGGSSTRDTPAIKEADVGISEDTKRTEMASKSSDIVISNKGSLYPILKLGRCAYHNI